jgi:hypothetical protein
MKDSFHDEACEEVAVRCGGFTLATHGAFRGGVSHRLACPVLYRREVGGSAVLADAAFAVAENHIHHPGQTVLHRPTIADERPERGRQQRQRRNVETRFPLDPAPGFAHALDHDDALQSWPNMALSRLSDIVDRDAGARLDAAAIAIGHLMQADCRGRESVGFPPRGEQLHILAQRALIELSVRGCN